MKKLHLLSLLALFIMGISACKYEEGPLVSFVSRKERVANTWVVNTGTINGTDVSSIPNFQRVIFFSAGTCQIFYEVLGTEFAYSGTWEFSEDQSQIHIHVTEDILGVDTYDNDWTILHLKDKLLKVSYTEDNDSYVIEFKPQA